MSEVAELSQPLNDLVLMGHLTLAEAWAAMDEALLMGEWLSMSEAGLLLAEMGLESAAQVLYLSDQLNEESVKH